MEKNQIKACPRLGGKMGNNTVVHFVGFSGGWSCKAESDGKDVTSEVLHLHK